MDFDCHNFSGSVSEHRHFPVRQAAVLKRRRTTNHIVRSTAKRVAEWGNDTKQGDQTKVARFDPSKKILRPRGPGPAKDYAVAAVPGDVERRRARLEKDIRSIIHFRGAGAGSLQQRERRAAAREALITADETLEGRELASSDVPLPSDRFRLAKTPSLERQEAFRVDSTAKSKLRVCHVGPASVADDAQIAALYGMGLLYDDAGARDFQQPAFNLNSIKHEEPVYTVRLANKRGRKGGRKAAAAGHDDLLSSALPLDVCLAPAGNHSAIAQYMRYPLGQCTGGRAGKHGSAGRKGAPLRIVYGAGGRNPSFDVETSQSDLEGDCFSEYECLSDREMDDDLPLQREVREPSNNLRCDTWIILG